MTKLSAPKPQWENQVIRTADGRLIVRGVDVPKTGSQWERIKSGKGLLVVSKPARAHSGWVLSPVTSKAKALAIARKAGLVSTPKATPSKTSAGAKPTDKARVPTTYAKARALKK